MLPGLLSARSAIVDDGTGVAPALAALLRAAGVDISVVDDLSADDPSADDLSADAAYSGVINLQGLAPLTSVDDAMALNQAVFATARAFATSESSMDFFVAVSNLGGAFGLGRSTDVVAPWSGGLTGLTRTAALEWPDTQVRAIDVDTDGRDPEAIAADIAGELLRGGTEHEVGLSATGERLVLVDSEMAPMVGRLPLGPSDVVVVSGGARGVTAATMIALARASGASFVLLGRSVLAPEPEPCVEAESDAALKAVLLAEARTSGVKVTPKELSATASKILAGREVRQTLEKIGQAGGRARYVAVDITDRTAVAEALATVRREIGPITGVVHGAGVLADKLIAEQTDDAFDRVFATKAGGLQVLLDETANDELAVLCLFSSVAARSGNRGQVAYAMANEVLNKVASSERRRRGSACVVKSLGWGPWDGGMVSPALKAHFEDMGVSLIDLDAGAAALVAELSSIQVDQVEVVLGGGVLPESGAQR